jgi:thioredoxin 2
MSPVTLDDRGVLVACPACGTRNRLDYRKLDKPAKCGKCKAPLPLPATPIEVPSLAAFDALVRDSVRPVVVDFWAPWCGPCRMVAPELEKVARSAAGEFLVVKINTEALPDLAQRYRIASIPTMAVFRAGRELQRTSGARPAADILAFVRGALPATAA